MIVFSGPCRLVRREKVHSLNISPGNSFTCRASRQGSQKDVHLKILAGELITCRTSRQGSTEGFWSRQPTTQLQKSLAKAGQNASLTLRVPI